MFEKIAKREIGESRIDLLKHYDSSSTDSSDEEDLRNTIGNIPVSWYKSYEHIGYSIQGRKLNKPISKDELDQFLERVEDADFWRSIEDEHTGQRVLLSREQLDMISNIKHNKTLIPDEEMYKPWPDTFTSDVLIHPISNGHDSKKSFEAMPFSEKKKIIKLAKAIRRGLITVSINNSSSANDLMNFSNIWGDSNNSTVRTARNHIPAPKAPLPTNFESYNPSIEFCFTQEEIDEWQNQSEDERKFSFVPKKYSSLLSVPSYPNYIKERFERSLNLYLCPRQLKQKVSVEADDILPDLPRPKDLEPFPCAIGVKYTGHAQAVTSISVDPTGQYLVSASLDQNVMFWEVDSGKCLRVLSFDTAVICVTWCPVKFSIVLIATDNKLFIANTQLGDSMQVEKSDDFLNNVGVGLEQSKIKNEAELSGVEWEKTKARRDVGLRFILHHEWPLSQVVWHSGGDYFATVLKCKNAPKSVLIHQLTSKMSQAPFFKLKGRVQAVHFHPKQPFLFLATQKYIRIYNLAKKCIIKKLITNAKCISSFAIHPLGDNIVVGSYDKKLSWFDLDLSLQAYKTLRHHENSIRSVAYHRLYPLFASASTDATAIICHGSVYADLLKNPLIVPVKVLRCGSKKGGASLLDCTFHPNQPWIFCASRNGQILLFT